MRNYIDACGRKFSLRSFGESARLARQITISLNSAFLIDAHFQFLSEMSL